MLEMDIRISKNIVTNILLSTSEFDCEQYNTLITLLYLYNHPESFVLIITSLLP